MSALPQGLQCMNMLDRLFSREIQRRTGAHAINIIIENDLKTRKRSRSRGSRALKSVTHTKVTTKKSSLLHRLNIRLPWLKFVAAIMIGAIVSADLLGVTISSLNESNLNLVAPMQHHPKATERTLEGKMLIALTFDDGPFPETTPRLLDVLTEKDVPATFFMLGMMARANPDIVKHIAKDHHEVASHTMYHQNLIRLTPEAAQADLNESKAVIKDITGSDPAFVRPPYGNYNDFVATAAACPLILWSVDTEDWSSKNADAIIATTMREVHDGAIILMHDIYPTSVDALPVLIDTLRSAGYEFATVSELAQTRNITLNPGQAYYNFRP